MSAVIVNSLFRSYDRLIQLPSVSVRCHEMRTKVLFLAAGPLAAAGLVAAVAVHVVISGIPAVCEELGGKWASVPSSCVTRLCYWTGTCGYWANPAARCARLKTNDPVSEVYFQLGEPDEVKGTRYMWHERKGRAVEAVIDHERLASLACATEGFS